MRDKLQTSARDLMKSMEQVIGRNKPSETNVKSLENTLRAVFSSCTSGAGANVKANNEMEYIDEPSEPHDTLPTDAFKTKSQKNDMGEHIYAQLFFDDQIRATKAVNALREHDVPKIPTTATCHPTSKHHKSFPGSTPTRPVQQADTSILPNPTFDDSISAISAHTLEAMARAAPMGHTPSFPHDAPTLKYDRVEPPLVFLPKEHDLSRTSKPFTPGFRVRSTGDQSTPSKNSQSTRTTDSSSFDDWQREDNKYWKDQAKKEKANKQVRRPSPGDYVSMLSL
jgi:hypothetical protein